MSRAQLSPQRAEKKTAPLPPSAGAHASSGWQSLPEQTILLFYPLHKERAHSQPGGGRNSASTNKPAAPAAAPSHSAPPDCACPPPALGRANSNLPRAASVRGGSGCADVIAPRPSYLRFPALACAVSVAERGKVYVCAVHCTVSVAFASGAGGQGLSATPPLQDRTLSSPTLPRG